jgi:hypothetical protein
VPLARQPFDRLHRVRGGAPSDKDCHQDGPFEEKLPERLSIRRPQRQPFIPVAFAELADEIADLHDKCDGKAQQNGNQLISAPSPGQMEVSAFSDRVQANMDVVLEELCKQRRRS